MFIKVCGLTDNESSRTIARLDGISHLGFIFYEKSPRFTKTSVQTSKSKIGVFVNEELSKVLELVEKHQLSGVQLHGDETPKFVESLPKTLLKIKAIGISSSADIEKAAPFEGIVDYLLFDTKSVSFGGTGKMFDWTILQNYKGNTPFILSGGIGLDSANELDSFYHPKFAGYDLNSRFEREPKVKNVAQIELFTKAVL